MPADLIIFAAIAIFVVLRLRSTLGQKTGHMDEHRDKMKKLAQDEEERVVQIYPKKSDDDDSEEMKDITPDDDAVNDDIAAAVREVRAIDEGFRVANFLSGAKMALDMVLDAFESGDKKPLKQLLADDVYADFESALKDREGADERTHVTLVSITDAEITQLDVKKSVATVTVRFLSEQIHQTKDKDGEVTEGSASDITTIEDEWVFERDLRSGNPNWSITAT